MLDAKGLAGESEKKKSSSTSNKACKSEEPLWLWSPEHTSPEVRNGEYQCANKKKCPKKL